MGIDIIIALAADKRTNYYELRMTLRSIENNLTGYRDIYLIGEKPVWITNVIHIPVNDIHHRKQFSIFRKFMVAAKTESVSDNFIRWDDDVYLLKTLNVSGIKDWYEGTLKEWSVKNINSLYRNVVKNTLQLFPDGLYYDVHAPRIFNKEKYRELNKYNWSATELLTKSTYFNSIKGEPVEMKDPKRNKGLFYSTSGKIRNDDNKMLKELFSNPSKYEQ
jgi:hypothetical protein